METEQIQLTDEEQTSIENEADGIIIIREEPMWRRVLNWLLLPLLVPFYIVSALFIISGYVLYGLLSGCCKWFYLYWLYMEGYGVIRDENIEAKIDPIRRELEVKIKAKIKKETKIYLLNENGETVVEVGYDRFSLIDKRFYYRYWNMKRSMLKDDYGIDWTAPTEINIFNNYCIGSFHCCTGFFLTITSMKRDITLSLP